jgi:ABC-type phosphate/phosphonate transport system ATPase subunit
VIGLAHGRVVFDGAPACLNDSVLQMIYDQPASPVGDAAEIVTAAAPAVSFNLATIED